MDLKFYEGHIILHLIGVCTQQKQRNSGKDNLLPMNISIGVLRQIFTDNGGEWENKDFIKMSKYMGIHIKTTAAESPGVAVELNAIIKHSKILVIKLINRIINQIINKIISDTH